MVEWWVGLLKTEGKFFAFEQVWGKNSGRVYDPTNSVNPESLKRAKVFDTPLRTKESAIRIVNKLNIRGPVIYKVEGVNCG